MDSIVEQLISDGDSLATQFEQDNSETRYIDEAMVCYRKALDYCSPSHPNRAPILTWLGQLCLDRYSQLGDLADIEEGVVLLQDALALGLPDHSNRATALRILSNLLCLRYKQLGGIDDVHKAIALDREALEICSPEDRSMFLTTLSSHLFMLYQELGGMDSLNEVITLAQDAVALFSPGDPDRSLSLFYLGMYLHTRFTQLGRMNDLEEAISFSKEALELCPTGLQFRPTCLNNLSRYLSTRYQQLGQIDDLDQAILLTRGVLEIVPSTHPVRPVCLNNLANSLQTRYDRLEGIDDLNESISFARRALDVCPPSSPNRSWPLNNLAMALGARYRKLKELDDINEAIDLAQDALALLPPAHPDRSVFSSNLAHLLSIRYHRLGTFNDLNWAIDLGHESLASLPQGHPGRSTTLSNLEPCLLARYEKLGDIVDLNVAITAARDVLVLQPPGHPHRSASLNNLAECLLVRFNQLGDEKDREEVFNTYGQMQFIRSTALLSSDFTIVKSWVNAAEYFHHSTTLLAYETTLRLLTEHLAALPPLPHHLSLLKAITSSVAADAFSACLRNQSPTKAVELLEQGRGVFWSQLARLRSPLDDVIASGPEGKTFADEFTRLTSLIRNILSTPGDNQHDRIFHLNVELQQLVSNIRKLPDLSRFLLPPSFSDLQRAASGGPVIIINASDYTCDALVVFSDKYPVHIPLSVTKQDVRGLSSKLGRFIKLSKSTDMTKELQYFLRELWDKVVCHIINFLQTVYPIRSRIWWCPTAEFSLLPLHAATPFRTDQKGVSDLYISSYTPTLNALIRARRPILSNSERKRFIAIGQANARGTTPLPSVGTELANIGQLVDGHSIFRRMEGEESCIPRVIEELGKNEWVHLACHGVPDRKQPFESAFKLHDGKFTIQHIIQSDLTNAEFAYLSACHTTVGDEESPDESLHLASAMQFAGFRSVIGTMWAVDDAETNKVTSVFYKHMIDASGRLDHTFAAAALRRTMKSVNIQMDQRILYIHLGA